MIQKIRSIKDIVYWMLCDFPETRDNDRLLLLKIWAHQNPLLRTDKFSFVDFGNEFAAGGYADPESIRRTRQKVQDAFINLRGKSYKERKKREGEMRRSINKIKFPEPLMRN